VEKAGRVLNVDTRSGLDAMCTINKTAIDTGLGIQEVGVVMVPEPNSWLPRRSKQSQTRRCRWGPAISQPSKHVLQGGDSGPEEGLRVPSPLIKILEPVEWATPSKSTCPSMLEMLTEGLKSTTPPVTGSGYKLVNTVDQLKR
jgi:hypothetical protein